MVCIEMPILTTFFFRSQNRQTKARMWAASEIPGRKAEIHTLKIPRILIRSSVDALRLVLA